MGWILRLRNGFRAVARVNAIIWQRACVGHQLSIPSGHALLIAKVISLLVLAHCHPSVRVLRLTQVHTLTSHKHSHFVFEPRVWERVPA